jgi:hypothetical protein
LLGRRLRVSFFGWIDLSFQLRSRLNLHWKATRNINLGGGKAKRKDGRKKGKGVHRAPWWGREERRLELLLSEKMEPRKGLAGLNRGDRCGSGARRRVSMGRSCGAIII